MARHVVELTQQYTAHDKVFDKVELRLPTYKDIFMDGLGVPEEWQPNGFGGSVLITDYACIGKYLQRLAVEPTAECLTDLGPVDSLRLERAVTGFFREPKTPPKSQDGSSSTEDGTAAA
jgi:hypothetical protein